MAQNPSSPANDTTIRSNGGSSGSVDDTLLAQGDLETAARPSHSANKETFPRGTAIGRYIVVQQLGEGGMGVVYAAYDPELDRRVAIKVLRPSRSDPTRLTGGRARLLREAQAMAQLNHSNVVSVFDVGTFEDPDGNPLVFVAMEFIEGETLKSWLTSRSSETGEQWREIVRTFIRAGRGLAAAHQHGIVHRDFKPANVMVDEARRIKVLDFGLARPGRPDSQSQDRATAHFSSDSLDLKLTRTGELLGTPVYMSPEQHRSDETGPPTDQFSFCVALFEALYGQRPFPGKSLQEIAVHVLKRDPAEPPKESVVPTPIREAIRRGLSRDPDDRFASMEDLLSALSWDPRARNRRLAWASGIAITLGGGIGAAWLLAPGARLCRTAGKPVDEVWNRSSTKALKEAFARVSAADGEALGTRAIEELDAYATSWKKAHRDACEANRIRGEQSDDLYELRLACLDRRLDRLEMTVEALGEADATSMHRSLEIIAEVPDVSICADEEILRTRLPLPDDPSVQREIEAIRGQIGRIQLLFTTGRFDEAEALAADLVARARSTEYEPVIAEALTARGEFDMHSGRTQSGAEVLEEALLRAEASGHDVVIVETLAGLIVIESQVRNRFDIAHAHAARAEAVMRRIGHDPLVRVQVRAHHANVFLLEGKYEEAVTRFRAVEQEWVDLGLDRDPRALYVLNKLVNALMAVGDTAEAEEVALRAVEIAELRLGRHHPRLAETLSGLARVRGGQGDPEAALAALTRANEIFRTAFGPEHVNVAATYNGMALQLRKLEREEEARQRFEEALAVMRAAYGEGHLQTAILLLNLGSLERHLGDQDRAIAHLELGTSIHDAKLAPNDDRRLFDHRLLGDVLLYSRRNEEAARHYRLVADLVERYPREDPAAAAGAWVGLAELARRRDEPAEAKALLDRAIEALDPDDPEDEEYLAKARMRLARVLRASDPRRAAELARAALPHYEEGLADGREYLREEAEAGRALVKP